jgi:hypothetical protein
VASAMLRFLQLSPEAKAKLLSQKAKRKRDLTQERDIQKRQKMYSASLRKQLSTENKSNELRVKKVLEDILRLVVEENKPASGNVAFIKEVIDITITTNKTPVKLNTKLGHRIRGMNWVLQSAKPMQSVSENTVLSALFLFRF